MALVKIIIKYLKVCTLFSFYILNFIACLYSIKWFYPNQKGKITCLQLILFENLLEDNCTLALKFLKKFNQGSKIGLVKDYEGNGENSAKSER